MVRCPRAQRSSASRPSASAYAAAVPATEHAGWSRRDRRRVPRPAAFDVEREAVPPRHHPEGPGARRCSCRTRGAHRVSPRRHLDRGRRRCPGPACRPPSGRGSASPRRTPSTKATDRSTGTCGTWRSRRPSPSSTGSPVPLSMSAAGMRYAEPYAAPQSSTRTKPVATTPRRSSRWTVLRRCDAESRPQSHGHVCRVTSREGPQFPTLNRAFRAARPRRRLLRVTAWVQRGSCMATNTGAGYRHGQVRSRSSCTTS